MSGNHEQIAALDEVSLWLDALKRETARYERLFGEQQKLRDQEARPGDDRLRESHSESASVAHWIVIAGHRLVKAMGLPHLPESIRSRDLSDELKERLTELRNIVEHREDYRPSLVDGRGGRAGDWYSERFPDRTPWSMSWSRDSGITLAGVLELEPMKAELAPLSEAVAEAVAALRDEVFGSTEDSPQP